jgi:hypothetical protein
MFKFQGKSWKSEAGAVRHAERVLVETNAVKWTVVRQDGKFFLLAFIHGRQLFMMRPLADHGFHVFGG